MNLMHIQQQLIVILSYLMLLHEYDFHNIHNIPCIVIEAEKSLSSQHIGM